MKIRSVAPALLLLFFLLPLQEALHRVTRVIDGDTIELEFEGHRERVRYIGIDTPELSDRRPTVRRLALRASAANAKRVKGRRVRLEFDVEKRDKYGRLLAYVWVGDTLVNERLVRAGYARIFTYPPNVRYVERFLAAERAARREGKGLWGKAAARARGPGADESAGRETPPIPAAEAGRHLGEWATVCGRVVGARYARGVRGRPTFLNFEKPYPQQLFTAVIWSDVRARFERPPEEAFEGRDVCVEGTVARYRNRGAPQIVVEDPGRIWLRSVSNR